MYQPQTDWECWIVYNLQLLSKRFGRRQVTLDAKTRRSLLIMNYPLPRTWRQRRSRLLIVLPKKGKIFHSAPDRFYLDRGLRTVSGKKPAHYFENRGFNDLSDKGLARFSFHMVKGWHPNRACRGGTTLLDLLAAFDRGLDSAAREVMK